MTDQPILYPMVVNAAMRLYSGKELTALERGSLVSLILARQNRYRGFLFYPPVDGQADIRLISGEKPKTRLLATNAVELETLRLLALLEPASPRVQEVLKEADERLQKQCFASVCLTGECVPASIAYLCLLTVWEPESHQGQIRHGLDILQQYRTAGGRWTKFPFFFTLLWLTELPARIAQPELEYAAERCRQLLGKSAANAEPQVDSRRLVLQRALALR